MAEQKLRFVCVYTDCKKETTVIVNMSGQRPKQHKSVAVVRYCEHCNRANKIAVPDNIDVHGFILGKDKRFLRTMSDGIPLIQGEKV